MTKSEGALAILPKIATYVKKSDSNLLLLKQTGEYYNTNCRTKPPSLYIDRDFLNKNWVNLVE